MVGYSYEGGVITPRKTLRDHKELTDVEAKKFCDLFSWYLGEVYGGYYWNVMMQDNVVFIRNMSLDNVNGISSTIDEFDPTGKLLKKIGGEILERYRMPRGPIDVSKYKGLIRDIKGNAYPDRG